jgi:hypothetical protein
MTRIYESLAGSLDAAMLRRELIAARTDGNDGWLLAVQREADRRRDAARRPRRTRRGR